MKLKIEIDEDTLKGLVRMHIEEKVNATIDTDKVRILVKSKQNYKSEWEVAAFKAEFEAEV